MPEITVIMPIYNAQAFLNQSIRSVLNQTFRDFELLLINDGSTDYSLLFCNGFAEKDGRIKVLNQEHGGLVAKRIDGVRAATGRYITFVDADDRVEPEYLEHMYTAAIEHDADISMCRVQMEYKDASILMYIPMEAGVYSGDALEKIKREVLISDPKGNHGCTLAPLCDKLIRREILLKNLCYLDTRITQGEEVILTVSCFLDSKRVCVGHEADYHYIKRKGSLSHCSHSDIEEQISLFSNVLNGSIAAHGYGELTDQVHAASVYLRNRLNRLT